MGGAGAPSVDEFLWAFGMVLSRAFVLKNTPRLLPFVDLLNHDPTVGRRARAPTLLARSQTRAFSSNWEVKNGGVATSVMKPQMSGRCATVQRTASRRQNCTIQACRHRHLPNAC